MSGTALVERRSWVWFATRASLIVLVLGAAGEYCRARYYVGIATQTRLCIPGYHVFLIDRWDTRPRRGKAFAFAARGLTGLLKGVPDAPVTADGSPVFADGAMLVKRLAGVPGDTFEVTRRRTTVNGRTVGHGLFLVPTLGRHHRDFERREQVPDGHYVFMGDTTDSFDSRYWGYVAREQIIGRAYAVF